MAAQSGLEEPPAQYGRYPRSIGAFLDATQSQIFVMQLPNVLPCVTDDADDVPAPKEQSAPSTSTDRSNSPIPSTTAANAPKHSVLHQLEEGQIGKILRYKSGRVKLLLGDTRFDLDMGLESGFLQVCLNLNESVSIATISIICLGTHVHQQQSRAAQRGHDQSGHHPGQVEGHSRLGASVRAAGEGDAASCNGKWHPSCLLHIVDSLLQFFDFELV